MSRDSVLLAAITSEPTTTSDLYDRIGYPTLTRLGLIPYHAFRAELLRLSAAGLASRDEAPDGSTVWWREEATSVNPPTSPTPPTPPAPPTPPGA